MEFTFKIITYGCKVNQYESQSLREYWQSLDGKELFDTHSPDIILLSGCAVTAQGVSDARQMVRKLLRDYPQSKVIVTGCAASAEPDDFAFENVVACIDQTAKWNLLYCHPLKIEALGRLKGTPPFNEELSQPLPPQKTLNSNNIEKYFFPKKEKEYPEFSISDFERSRPVLKIQDGCSHGCSYCIVPFTRGSARSRDVGESLAEFSRLIDKGFREIVISGINLRQYQFKEHVKAVKETKEGKETGNFWKFLRRLHKHVQEENLYTLAEKNSLSNQIREMINKKIQAPIRIRLSSLEPSQITQEGLETLEELSEQGFLCPHLHLSLQSGSEGVLKRMGREHYAPETIIDIMQKIQSFWPTFALGADFLMGFAGETESELEETLQLVDALPLTYAHVFPYSIRPKTKAANLSGQLEKKVRQEHAKKIRERIDIKKNAFMHSMLKLDSMWVSLDCTHDKELPTNIEQETTTKNISEEIKLIGWNEFYVSCQIDLNKNNDSNNNKVTSEKNYSFNTSHELQNLLISHELIKVKPIKIIEDKLVTNLF